MGANKFVGCSAARLTDRQLQPVWTGYGQLSAPSVGAAKKRGNIPFRRVPCAARWQGVLFDHPIWRRLMAYSRHGSNPNLP